MYSSTDISQYKTLQPTDAQVEPQTATYYKMPSRLSDKTAVGQS